jgi:dUTP diphosphatase
MTAALAVPVRRLEHASDLPLPEPASAGSAGLDLLAAVSEPTQLLSGQWRLIPTGLALALPQGYEAQIRPRSGLALHRGITVLNSPGTVDSDYRGEIGVVLINHGPAPFLIQRGDRIAQLVIASVQSVSWNEVTELPESGRAAGGFGSTG